MFNLFSLLFLSDLNLCIVTQLSLCVSGMEKKIACLTNKDLTALVVGDLTSAYFLFIIAKRTQSTCILNSLLRG